MAKGIIFQTQETQLFFILLLQTTTTSLVEDNCIQLTRIKDRDKCERRRPTMMDKDMVCHFLLLKAHNTPTRPIEISSFNHILRGNLSFESYQAKKHTFIGVLDFQMANRENHEHSHNHKAFDKNSGS